MITPMLGQIVLYRYSEPELHVWHGVVNGADECPAVITRVWTHTTVNLKLLNDGNGVFWVTSRIFGLEPGQWRYPDHG